MFFRETLAKNLAWVVERIREGLSFNAIRLHLDLPSIGIQSAKLQLNP